MPFLNNLQQTNPTALYNRLNGLGGLGFVLSSVKPRDNGNPPFPSCGAFLFTPQLETLCKEQIYQSRKPDGGRWPYKHLGQVII